MVSGVLLFGVFLFLIWYFGFVVFWGFFLVWEVFCVLVLFVLLFFGCLWFVFFFFQQSLHSKFALDMVVLHTAA